MTKDELRLLIIDELEEYHKLGVQYWRESTGPWDHVDRIMKAVEQLPPREQFPFPTTQAEADDFEGELLAHRRAWESRHDREHRRFFSGGREGY